MTSFFTILNNVCNLTLCIVRFSRKHNVFMYGCNRVPADCTAENSDEARANNLVNERIFPWLMSRMVR